MQILVEPKNALVKQYQRFFNYDSIDLVFTEDALWEISDKALERETGARGLRSIIEDALLDVMFELPSRNDVSKCVITKETISKGQRPTLVTSAGARRRATRTSSSKSRRSSDYNCSQLLWRLTTADSSWACVSAGVKWMQYTPVVWSTLVTFADEFRMDPSSRIWP